MFAGRLIVGVPLHAIHGGRWDEVAGQAVWQSVIHSRLIG